MLNIRRSFSWKSSQDLRILVNICDTGRVKHSFVYEHTVITFVYHLISMFHCTYFYPKQYLAITSSTLVLTDRGVSLFNMTCKRCGGRMGGPETFSHGLFAGISWEYSPAKHSNMRYAWQDTMITAINLNLFHFFISNLTDSLTLTTN
jgi:hypothetical protein